MSLKWIALSMMLGGAGASVGAYKMDSKSSFDDGSFLIQILLGGAGAISFAIGVVLILVSWFMSIP